MTNFETIQYLQQEVKRIKAHVGMPEDDFVPPKKALTMMGYGAGLSEIKLRDLLKRALWAHDAGAPCPLILGEHYNAFPNGERTTWLVNWPKMKEALSRGPALWAEVPEIPESYGAA